MVSDSAPIPLQRDTFPTHRLMTEHPPVLRDPNKQLVCEVACPAGTVHEREISYSRWPTPTEERGQATPVLGTWWRASDES